MSQIFVLFYNRLKIKNNLEQFYKLIYSETEKVYFKRVGNSYTSLLISIVAYHCFFMNMK